MEQASFQFTDVAPRVLRSDGDSGGMRDSVASVVDRSSKNKTKERLIGAWISTKRTRKITRSRDVIGKHWVKLLRERRHRVHGDQVKVRICRGGKWSSGEWIARGLTDIDDAKPAIVSATVQNKGDSR